MKLDQNGIPENECIDCGEICEELTPDGNCPDCWMDGYTGT